MVMYGGRGGGRVPSIVVCGSKVCVVGSKHSIAACLSSQIRLLGLVRLP